MLTVRQIFILSILLKQQTEVKYKTTTLHKRRKHAVCVNSKIFKTIKALTYLNKNHDIYSANYKTCKTKMFEYLVTLSCDETERFLC